MARFAALCLLLLTTSLHHDVMGFALHKRHSRSTDLADALHMLERQRRRIDKEETYLSPTPQSRDNKGLTMADLEPWYNTRGMGVPATNDDQLTAAWLAKAMTYDGQGDYDRGFGEFLPAPRQPPSPLTELHTPQLAAVAAPVELEPTDQELDAMFGDKKEDENNKADQNRKVKRVPLDMEKKDKEKMAEVTGDAMPKIQTRSDVTSNSDDVEGDVSLTRDEFRTLLKAVEKLQQQAMDDSAREEDEGEAVAEAVRDKFAEARRVAEAEVAKAAAQQEAEVVQAAAQQEAAAVSALEAVKEVEEEAEDDVVEESLTPRPQPVTNEELDNLFDNDQLDEVKEVIPSENGEIVKTEKILKDPEGRPVGHEEIVEQVQTLPDNSLSSIQDLWYLKNYLEQDGDRKKRNSKRSNYMPPTFGGERVVVPEPAISQDAAQLMKAYVAKINQLQSELDQARLVSYLEDLENDILTDALNEATLAQVNGRINPEELTSLQDAIKVEEALQQVKVNRDEATVLADNLSEEIADRFGLEKRGGPLRKKNDVTQPQIPIMLTADDVDNDVRDKDEEEEKAERSALALGRWFDPDEGEKIDLDDMFGPPQDDVGYRLDKDDLGYRLDNEDDELIRQSGQPVASLFVDSADECPAVHEFSSDCEFAGDSVDYEAKALCNMHEMCYVCGESLDVSQGQCDFIYRAAATMLCQQDEECGWEAEEFLNSMKLKHRFVPYTQDICRSRCVEEFLSIV